MGGTVLLASLLAVSVAANAGATFSFLRRRRLRRRHQPTSRKLDPRRYLVTMYDGPDNVTLYQGYDAVLARRAWEEAPMQAGWTAEFWEWNAQRGSKTA